MSLWGCLSTSATALRGPSSVMFDLYDDAGNINDDPKIRDAHDAETVETAHSKPNIPDVDVAPAPKAFVATLATIPLGLYYNVESARPRCLTNAELAAEAAHALLR